MSSFVSLIYESMKALCNQTLGPGFVIKTFEHFWLLALHNEKQFISDFMQKQNLTFNFLLQPI